MDRTSDLDALARRYVDLWQDQWTAMAADPETTAALIRWMDLYTGKTADPAAMVRAMLTPLAGAPAPSADDRARGAAGTATAGTASDGGAGGMDDCLRRIAELERRLARLEDAPVAGRPRRGARKPRS